MSEDASIQLDDIKDRLSIASQPPPYLSDKMIRGKDQGDYNRKGLELAVATGFNVVALGATIAMLINRQIGPLWGGLDYLNAYFLYATSGSLGRTALNLTKSRYISKKGRYDPVFEDPVLKCKVGLFAYRGRRMEVGIDEIKKGESMLEIDLPRLQSDQGIVEADGTLRYQTALLKYIKQLKYHRQKGIKMVAVRGLQNISSHIETTSAQDVYEGKIDLDPHSSQEPILTLTPDEFEKLSTESYERIAQLITHLNDSQVQKWYEIGCSTSDEREKEKILTAIRRRTLAIMERRLDMSYNGPERVIENYTSIGEQYSVPRREVRKHSRSSQIVSGPAGLLFRQVNYESGSIQERHVGSLLFSHAIGDGRDHRAVDIDKILDTSLTPIEDILADTSPLRQARLAYLLFKLIHDSEGDVFTDTSRSPKEELEEILAELAQNGQTIVRDALKEKEITFSSIASHIAKKTNLLSLAVGFLTVESLGGFPMSKNMISYLTHMRKDVAAVSTAGEEGYLNPTQNGGGGEPYEIWAVTSASSTASGPRLSTGGYFIENTAVQYDDGRGWKYEKDVKEKVDALPTYLDSTVAHLRLERNIIVGPNGSVEFKIPMRDGMSLGSLYVFDTHDAESELDYFALRLEDNTILLRVNSDAPRLRSLSITANLVEDPTYAIRPATPLQETIDPRSISPEATKWLEKLGIKEGADADTVFQAIKNSDRYSVKEGSNGALPKAFTPEERLSIEASMKTADCDVANEEAILANAYVGNKDRVMAVGFVSHYSGNDEFKEMGSLRTDSAHAFAIDLSGRVHDATPTKLASDKETVDYLEQLNEPAQKPDLVNVNKFLDFTNLMMLLGGTGAVTLGPYFLAKRAKERGINLKELMKKAMIGGIPKRDLLLGYNFFTSLRFSQIPEDALLNLRREEPQGELTFDKIQLEIPVETLVSYLESPKSYERLAKLKGRDAMGLRTLAYLLLKI